MGALPPLTNAELVFTIGVWTEILAGEVPETDLVKAYVRAARDKKSSFGLTATEIVQGYRAFCESERVSGMPQDNNLLPGRVCGKCHGTGMELVWTDRNYQLARRCDHVEEITEEMLEAAGI